jgi:hypothetical protein
MRACAQTWGACIYARACLLSCSIVCLPLHILPHTSVPFSPVVLPAGLPQGPGGQAPIPASLGLDSASRLKRQREQHGGISHHILGQDAAQIGGFGNPGLMNLGRLNVWAFGLSVVCSLN